MRLRHLEQITKASALLFVIGYEYNRKNPIMPRDGSGAGDNAIEAGETKIHGAGDVGYSSNEVATSILMWYCRLGQP